MSIQDVGWVLDQDISNAGAKLVLVCLANHIHPKMDHSFPSVATIAQEASMAVRSVQRHLNWLQKEDYLLIEESFDKNSRQRSNKYRLNYERQSGQEREGAKLSPSLEQAENTSQGGGCQNVTLGGCQIDGGEGDTAVTPEGDNVVTPLKEIGKEIRKSPLTPKEGDGAALADAEWEKLCEGWVLSLGDSYERARRPWAKLDIFDRGLALKHAKAFQEGNPKPHLTTYLRQKRWQSYEQAAANRKNNSGGVGFFIEEGSEEFRAWSQYRGLTAIVIRFYPAVKKTGFYARTQWPPGHERDKQKTG